MCQVIKSSKKQSYAIRQALIINKSVAVIQELADWQAGQRALPASSMYKGDFFNRKCFHGVSKQLKRTDLGSIQGKPFKPVNLSLSGCRNRPPG